MSDKIIIVKGTFKVTDVTRKLFTNTNDLIISLDYESHKQLRDLNIKHVGYEKYLDDSDIQIINKTVFDISITWHKNEKIQKYLTFDEINFGWLLDQELYFYFLTTVTNFVSLMKIKKSTATNSLIISNDLIDMSKIIFSDCEIHMLEKEKYDTQLFTYDVYSIKYNIGPFPLTVRIPRKYFFVLRKYYERTIIPLYNKIFSHKRKESASILLVDFNPAREDEFIKCLSRKNKNVYLLNRRRAAIWNLKSFLTVKNTNSIPISYEQFLNSNDKIEIETLTKNIIQKLNSLLLDEELFSKIFSMNNHSFWKSIQKYFKNYCINRFSEAAYEMIGSKKMLDNIRPSAVLHFFGVALQEKILIHEVTKRNILAVMVQHGTPHIFYPDWSKFNPMSGTLPVCDEKMVFWGEMMKNYALTNGMKENNIVVSGSIRHDSYFKKKVPTSQEGVILVALMPFVIFQAEDQAIAAFDKYEESLKIVCRILAKIKDRKKIIKMHPGDMAFNTVYVEPIIRSIDPSIQIVVEADLPTLISSSSIVITLGLTTFLLDANILERPTVTLMYNHGEFLSRLSNGHSQLFENDNSDKFEEYIHSILTNKEIRDENIRKGIEFVNSYLANHGSASEYLAKKISEYT